MKPSIIKIYIYVFQLKVITILGWFYVNQQTIFSMTSLPKIFLNLNKKMGEIFQNKQILPCYLPRIKKLFSPLLHPDSHIELSAFCYITKRHTYGKAYTIRDITTITIFTLAVAYTMTRLNNPSLCTVWQLLTQHEIFFQKHSREKHSSPSVWALYTCRSKCLMNSYTLSMLCHLYWLCHDSCFFVSKSIGSLGTKTKYQCTSWHLETASALHIITAKLLLSSLFCAEYSRAGSSLHALSFMYWQIKTYTSYYEQAFKFKPVSLWGQKHIYSHTDMWSAWDVWPDKLHTLVGTDFLMASECVSVSFCVCVWGLMSVCSSNAG